MNSELDRIKSTITISLGTKNKLRKIKGSFSYEEYINYLLRMRNNLTHKSENVIELQKFNRKKGVYHSYKGYTVLFSYNEYNDSDNFIFDIKVDTVRKEGKKISYSKYIQDVAAKKNKNTVKAEIEEYFHLLQVAIQKEIEPTFKHKGTYADYFTWEQEFKVLNLNQKSLEEDVLEKLNAYL